jgi:hypothetical protein
MTDDDQFRLPDDCDACIRELHTYWRSIQPDEGLPSRRDFDPLALSAECWPYLWLIDVERDPLRFCVRLMGTKIVRYYRGEFIGKWLDDMAPDAENSGEFAQFRDCVDKGAPDYQKIKMPRQEKGLWPGERARHEASPAAQRVCLPLASNNSAVDVLLLLTRFPETRMSRSQLKL